MPQCTEKMTKFLRGDIVRSNGVAVMSPPLGEQWPSRRVSVFLVVLLKEFGKLSPDEGGRVRVRSSLRAVGSLTLIIGSALLASPDSSATTTVTHSPLPAHAIQHIVVIDFENESESSLFGASSGATYLTHVLEPQGTLLTNYFGIGHASADNYLAQISGQAPNVTSSNDCIVNLSTYQGTFNNIRPGTWAANQTRYPGQIAGLGCVYPSSVLTIGNQLDRLPHPHVRFTWREYAEDMGNSPQRDGGVADPLGGTDCAHPVQTNGQALDNTNSATSNDQYVDRHNPFIYFHSVIDNTKYCAVHVVPLGHVIKKSSSYVPVGHLVNDFSSLVTTPEFSFISPNVCNDGHDSPCVGTDSRGLSQGGTSAINDWLMTWMPVILKSPAYRNGSMMVVITSDEGASNDLSAGDGERSGPSNPSPGSSFAQVFKSASSAMVAVNPRAIPLSTGGGRVGALLLAPRWIRGGVVNSAGSYNHYSALRTFEDLLGIHSGGADGQGHLGYAAVSHDFAASIFSRQPLHTGSS